MKTFRSLNIRETISSGALAGAAGGVAEIVWISFWASVTGADAAEIARGVAAIFTSGATVGLGIAIHMALAVALGIALVPAIRAVSGRLSGAFSDYVLALAALSAVWMVNFLVLLPVISPTFVALVPFPISLTSKLLFAVAAAATLRYRAGTHHFQSAEA